MHRKIVTITKNATNPSHQGARDGVDRLAATLNVELKHLVPNVPDNIEEQISFLNDMISARPDAILLAPANISALDPVLKRVDAAGIPVIMFIGRTTSAHYVTFIGSNDYAMTQDVARALCENLGGAGKIGIIDGNPLGSNFKDRANGFRDGVAEYPDVQIAGTRIGNLLREPARVAMLSLLDEHPALDGVLVANDFMALGVIDAIREHGLKIKIGSVNATPDGVACIKTGDILVTAAFNSMAMECLALEAAIRHLNGESIPTEIILPVEIVSLRNLAAWDVPYSLRPLPVWPQNPS